jgi:signal transduction histidine kinase
MTDSVPALDEPRRRPWWSLSAISIEYKLPLFICALILAVSAAYSWAAYRNVRVTELTGARARLESITGQLTGMLQGQTTLLIDSMRASPVNRALRAYLAEPTAARRPAALEALAHLGPQRAQVVSTELWSAERVRQLQDARDAGVPPLGLEPENVQWGPGPDSGAVGRLQVVGRDSMVYPVSTVLADRGRPLGYVVQWRRIVSSARTREQTLQLIGSGAGLYIGNDRGEVWMDLLHVTPKPPVDVRARDSILEYTRPGVGRMLARARPIAGTAWVVLVEFPQSVILAPLIPVVRRLAVFTALVVVAGLAASWMVGRRIAKPLRDLTDASAAIAAGVYSHPVAIDREDELGGLAVSFNTMLGRVRDSQHALEEQVRHRTAELEERNEELEGFGYSISHDLRAPLRAMQGFSQALLEDSGDRLDAMGKEYAERIVAGARRMDQLIQDLLAYSRVSRSELRLVPVPLGTVARAVLAELEQPIRSRKAVVRVDDPLPEVLGHPATLTQVLTNLLGNALKFVPAGRTPALRLWAENGAGPVRVWIEDNGIGIAGEHRDRIFRVFERLHSGEEYPGTGIGLAIVRKAVERMGGRVGVESAPGQGSRFWVELQRVERGGEIA